MSSDEPVRQVSSPSRISLQSRDHLRHQPREESSHHQGVNEQAEFLFPDNMAPLSSMNVVEGLREDITTNNTNTLGGNTLHVNQGLHFTQSAKTQSPQVAVSSRPMTSPSTPLSTEVRRNNIPYTKQRKDIRGLDDTKITAISGALAGFISGIVVCPLDVTKTRLQAQGLNGAENPYYKGIIGTMTTIAKDEGVRGLYKGVVPIVLGYFPTWTIYFSVYEFSKRLYPKWFPNSDFVAHSCSAITAGAASTTLTNPIWVVKTRLMLQSNLGPASTHYKGTLDAFRCIWNQEGIRALYRGLVPSLLGLFHVAIHFPVYEKLKLRFKCYSLQQGGDATTYGYEIHLPNLIMASSISKMIASGLTYPHEILRTRMQIRPTINTNNGGNADLSVEIQKKLIPMIKATYRNEGMKGFYSGFTANLLRTVPASAITLVSFEYVRNKLSTFNV